MRALCHFSHVVPAFAGTRGKRTSARLRPGRRKWLDAPFSAAILNHMVKYTDQALDRTFAALADPTRRALLARLGQPGSISVSELAQPFSMSLPPAMNHLGRLSDAGPVPP